MFRNWLLRRVKVVAPSAGTNRREQEGTPVSRNGKSYVNFYSQMLFHNKCLQDYILDRFFLTELHDEI